MSDLVCTGLPHVRAPHLRGSRLRTVPLHGVCVHTTGRGVPARARREGRDPLEVALAIYSAPRANFPHAVVAQDGRLAAVADERVESWTAGRTSRAALAAYRRGWPAGEGTTVARLWRAEWPHLAGPLGLCDRPNARYLHVELIPDDHAGYSGAQLAALAAWIADVWRRWALPALGTARAAGRLVGHEDVDPLARCDAGGGWDPGALREAPRLCWQAVADMAVAQAAARRIA